MRTLRFAVPALALCVALSACGGTGGPATPSPTGATPVPSQPSAGPTDPTTPPSTPPAGSSTPSAGASTSLTGTVTSGVEPNCLLLDGYLLLGGPRDVLRAGAKVTVTGRVEPGLMTTCQQGTPFQVETARPA
ncbi:hypothetical protein JNW91_08900 [Micromonospora sp. STR1_7]|uniref:DUF5666 domain-containing protein n=1 Tax=Micromonospora parastrephiae TaxID=2806101 RepID=A0ABS1XS19_9ACTN|nr:hypothetical protein [Micromonospora parastrephiae]MBM0231969.1 hypothetical protein [Micromonospora parastrephiae]